MKFEELSDGRYSAEYGISAPFENPLEVVRIQWISEQTVDFSEELAHALWTLWDKGESGAEPPSTGATACFCGEVRITVREFIEARERSV